MGNRANFNEDTKSSIINMNYLIVKVNGVAASIFSINQIFFHRSGQYTEFMPFTF